MIEMRIPQWIKLDHTVSWAASVHLQTHPPILTDNLDGPQLAVGQLQVGRRRGELHTRLLRYQMMWPTEKDFRGQIPPLLPA
jgi:hypothetical protein